MNTAYERRPGIGIVWCVLELRNQPRFYVRWNPVTPSTNAKSLRETFPFFVSTQCDVNSAGGLAQVESKVLHCPDVLGLHMCSILNRCEHHRNVRNYRKVRVILCNCPITLVRASNGTSQSKAYRYAAHTSLV